MSDSHPSAGSSRARPSENRPRWEPPPPEQIATAIPGCVIERLLGRGAMGAVYLARQTSLDRRVAVKIISSELDDEEVNFAERFKNEARALAKLSHPGIVGVYDSGQTPDGLLYIVMELVEGTDVARMIVEQGRLHTAHAMAITAHVCDALAYAHEQGIIHRDIKPANIMVGYDGVVKVADFGLAKINKGGETAGLTQGAIAMGTLHYMAPEALMLATKVDHRADLYAMGVMLYQMLTGKLPQGLFEMPSLQVPGLDPRYDGIIARALREDRNLRYSSAREFRHDLDTILTQPVVKVDPSATQAPAALPTQARPKRPEEPSLDVERGNELHDGNFAQPPASPPIRWPVWSACAFAILLIAGSFLWTRRPLSITPKPTAGQAERILPGPTKSPDGVTTTPNPAGENRTPRKSDGAKATTMVSGSVTGDTSPPAALESTTPSQPPSAEPFEFEWGNTEGRSIQAGFGGLADGETTLLTATGPARYPLNKLTNSSVQLAQKLAASQQARMTKAGDVSWGNHVLAWHNFIGTVSLNEAPSVFTEENGTWLFDGFGTRTSYWLALGTTEKLADGFDLELQMEVSTLKGSPWIDARLPAPDGGVCEIALRPPEIAKDKGKLYLGLPQNREHLRYRMRCLLEPEHQGHAAIMHFVLHDSEGQDKFGSITAASQIHVAGQRGINLAVYNGSVVFHRIALCDYQGNVAAPRTSWTTSREISRAYVHELVATQTAIDGFAGTAARAGSHPRGLVARFVFDTATAEKGADLFNASQHDGVLELRGKYREHLAHLNVPKLTSGSFTALVSLKPSASTLFLLCNGTNLDKDTRWWLSLYRTRGGSIRLAVNSPGTEKEFGNVSVPDEKWTKLVITYDSKSRKVIVRNHLDQRAELSLSEEQAASQPTTVWSFTDYARGQTFNGLVDDFLLFDRVLSDAELNSLGCRSARIE